MFWFQVSASRWPRASSQIEKETAQNRRAGLRARQIRMNVTHPDTVGTEADPTFTLMLMHLAQVFSCL